MNCGCQQIPEGDEIKTQEAEYFNIRNKLFPAKDSVLENFLLFFASKGNFISKIYYNGDLISIKVDISKLYLGAKDLMELSEKFPSATIHNNEAELIKRLYK